MRGSPDNLAIGQCCWIEVKVWLLIHHPSEDGREDGLVITNELIDYGANRYVKHMCAALLQKQSLIEAKKMKLRAILISLKALLHQDFRLALLYFVFGDLTASYILPENISTLFMLKLPMSIDSSINLKSFSSIRQFAFFYLLDTIID